MRGRGWEGNRGRELRLDMSEGPFRRVRVEEVVGRQTGEGVEVEEAGVAHG